MINKGIQQGDVWQLGDHILGCGSSLEKDFVEKVIGKNKIRCIMTDPPYGVSYTDSKKMLENVGKEIAVDRTIIGDEKQTTAEYTEFTKSWLLKAAPHLDDYNACYIFNVDLMTCAIRSGMAQAGFYFSQTLVWVKNNSILGRKDYLPM